MSAGADLAGRAGRPVGKDLEHSADDVVDPPVDRTRTVRQTGGGHVLGELGPLLTGHPQGSAPPGRGEQVPREDEEGAPHGELLDDAALTVERLVDVLDRDALGAGPQRQVDGGGLGRVQDRHRPRRALRIVVRLREAVAGPQTSTSGSPR
ncbi:hypothetical protein ASE01_10255 [Nocardioides sp. Root190]|nr:hypothetical protein ASE01_10255 [Nocardioides sp. Root190]